MKSVRRTFSTRSTKYSSSQGAAKARWPLKMTRSKQESTATIKLVNLVMKRDSVFMAFSSGRGPVQTPFWRGNAVLVNPFWLRLCRVGKRRADRHGREWEVADGRFHRDEARRHQRLRVR